MSARQVVRIDTVRVNAGAFPEPAAVRASLPAALRRYLDRPDSMASRPVDRVASQVAMAVRRALEAESIER